MRLRQSLLTTADSCLRKMQYSLADNIRRSGGVRAVGVGYHAGQEAYYDDRRNGMDAEEGVDRVPFYVAEAVFAFDKEASCEHFAWGEPYRDRQSAVDAITAMLTAYHRLHHFWPDDYEVLGTEVEFDLDFQMGHRRTGTIDLVLLGPDDHVYGVDHKTTAGRKWAAGKEHPRRNNQGPWYLPALQALFPGHAGYRFVFDIMRPSGAFERRVADPSPVHVAAVERKALQVAAVYEFAERSGVPLPGNPSSNLCSAAYCDFFDVCEHGAVLG